MTKDGLEYKLKILEQNLAETIFLDNGKGILSHRCHHWTRCRVVKSSRRLLSKKLSEGREKRVLRRPVGAKSGRGDGNTAW